MGFEDFSETKKPSEIPAEGEKPKNIENDLEGLKKETDEGFQAKHPTLENYLEELEYAKRDIVAAQEIGDAGIDVSAVLEETRARQAELEAKIGELRSKKPKS